MSKDYEPRTRPLVPVGHDCWIAVSRVPRPPAGKKMTDYTIDEQIECMLRWITAPGHDMHQRRDDLEALAELVIKARGNKVPVGRNGYTWDGDHNFGYGVKPIDSDTHDPDCIVCGDATAFEKLGHDADFDRHPYTPAPEAAAS